MNKRFTVLPNFVDHVEPWFNSLKDRNEKDCNAGKRRRICHYCR